MSTRYKALIHSGVFVDYNRLEKGIYISTIPYIFELEESIETLIKKADTVRRFIGNHHVSDEWYENIKLCTLSEISIKIENK